MKRTADIMGKLRTQLAAFAAASAGVLVFFLLQLPLPFLLGPMAGCLVAALAGVSMRGVPTISNAMRTVLGVAVGASITPAVVSQLGGMAFSIALVPPYVVLVGLIGYPYFRRFCGFDPATSYYAAMPGGLQDMLVFGEEAGGDPRILSLIHATRILIIVAALPVILSVGFSIDLHKPPGAPASEIPMYELGAMALIGLVGWQVARAVGLFGASILGPMILATVASLSGVIEHRPPAEAIWAAQFFIGFGVGVKYVGVTLRELRQVVLAGIGYTGILAVLSAIVSYGVITAGLAPPIEGILAFSPGGQAEMAVLAIVSGVDVAFVVTHHIVRIVTVIVGAPLMYRLMG